jgi:signal transduction histidine kinase
MTRKLSNQFLGNFWVTFLLTVLATVLAFVLLSFASGLISDSLAKNRYSASSIIKEDYRQIDASPVVENGGGVQIVDKGYRVVYSKGIDTIGKENLSIQEFTRFLTESKTKPYHYDILYQPEGEFWLIVTFPTSIRLDFNLVYNKEASPDDLMRAGGAFAFVILIYLLILALFSYIFSRITAARITVPLKKLCDGTRLLREGDYSARVDLRLKNEFAELQDTFNDMAARIEQEIALRKKSEEDRRRLILDISHDLKNPLSSIQGYAELLCKKSESPELDAIYKNSQRANRLLNELFELSKMDSPDFSFKPQRTDICETLRRICGDVIPQLDSAHFKYEFDIPEKSIYVMLDAGHFGRIIQNLADNAIRYNPSGTTVSVCLTVQNEMVIIDFSDDGVGIPEHLAQDIFKPFVRVDDSRSSETGGSGLGLSIAKKIALLHGGNLILLQAGQKGCTFRITIPAI